MSRRGRRLRGWLAVALLGTSAGTVRAIVTELAKAFEQEPTAGTRPAAGR
jgi:hypothetical protein